MSLISYRIMFLSCVIETSINSQTILFRFLSFSFSLSKKSTTIISGQHFLSLSFVISVLHLYISHQSSVSDMFPSMISYHLFSVSVLQNGSVSHPKTYKRVLAAAATVLLLLLLLPLFLFILLLQMLLLPFRAGQS